MSETSRAAESTKRAMDDTARSSQAAIDAAGKATKDAIGETRQLSQQATENAKETGEKVTETVAQTTEAAAKLSANTAEQGRDATMTGLRSAALVSSRVADISVGRSHQMMTTAANAMDVYRDASERSAARVQALFSSAMILGRGLQQMQQAWLQMVDHSMETSAHKPQDLLRCKNVVELAEVQRGLYLDAVNHAFVSTSRLLELAGRTAQDAVRPLQSHH